MRTHKRMQAMVPVEVYDQIDRYCGQNGVAIGDFVRFALQLAANALDQSQARIVNYVVADNGQLKLLE